MTPIIVSYGTPHYHDLLARLTAGLESHDVEHEVEHTPDLGSWQRNCAYKSRFIEKMRNKHKNRPVVWIDADATIERNPLPLFLDYQVRDIDIAARMTDNPDHPWNRVMSGTVYFGTRTRVDHLVRRWKHHCMVKPHRWDQVSLALAIEEKFNGEPYVAVPLDEPYCAVAGRRTTQHPPVIVHWQASRTLKHLVGDAGDEG